MSKTKIVEVPGMGNIEFPADMSDDDIGKALSASTAPEDPVAARKEAMQRGIANMPLPVRAMSKLGQEVSKAVDSPRDYIIEGIDPETGGPNFVQRALRGGIQGATGGFSDEIGGAITAATSKTSYEQARDAIRAKNAAAQAASGGEYGAMSLLGAIAPIALTGGAAAPEVAPSVLGTAGRGALGGAAYGGAFGAGHAEENVPTETLKGAALGGVMGGGLGTLAGLAKKLQMSVPAVKAWLERQAGQQAVKGLGGTRIDAGRLDNPARGGVPGTAAKIGRVALKEGVPLSDPQAAAAATRAMKAEAGARMGAVKSAPGSESAVDFPAFAASVRQDVISPLMSPLKPQFRGTAIKANEWLDDVALGMLRKRAAEQGRALVPVAEVGNEPAMAKALQSFEEFAGKGVKPKWTVLSDEPEKALGKLSLEEAHQIRQGLDELSGAYGIPSEATPLMKETWIAARNKLADQMSTGAEAIGKGAEWQGASAAFRDAAKLNKLAQRGAERQAGNDIVGLTDVVAGAGGLAHSPASGLLAGAAHKVFKTWGPELGAKGAFAAADTLPGMAKALQSPVSAAARYGPTETVALSETGDPPGPDPVKVLTQAVEGNQQGLGKYTADVAARLKEGGPEAVGRWHYLQASKDPEYRMTMKRLTQTGDEP
jgi:hypothetical protein